MMSTSTVSVVIPHYNYGQYLPVAVASALEQEDVDVEVIIVDDASTDGSIDVARDLAARHANVHLITHRQNMRHIRTYNDGLKAARGDYLVLLSADDALAPRALARACAVFERDPEVALVYGSVVTFSGELPTFEDAPVGVEVWEGREWIQGMCAGARNLIVNPEAMMRRSVFEEIGGYRSDLPHSADMYLWLQAATRGRVARVTGPVQACYRTHTANMHLTRFGGLLDDVQERRRTMDEFFARDGMNLRGAVAMHERSRRALAREALLLGALESARSRDPDASRELRRFAEETSVGASRTSAWLWALVVERLCRLNAVSHLVELLERVRWSIRWRRDARGILPR